MRKSIFSALVIAFILLPLSSGAQSKIEQLVNARKILIAEVGELEQSTPERESTGGFTYYLPFFDSSENHWTGLALMNDSLFSADVDLKIYNNDGVLERQTTTMIPGSGQATSMIYCPSGAGWVEISTDNNLFGLALIANNSAPTMYDIDIKTELHNMFVVAHAVADSFWDTTVMVCNPNNSETRIGFVYFSKSGQTINSEWYYPVPAKGSAQINIGSMFGVALSGGALGIVSAPGSIAAFVLYSNAGGIQFQDWQAGLSAIPLSE